MSLLLRVFVAVTLVSAARSGVPLTGGSFALVSHMHSMALLFYQLRSLRSHRLSSNHLVVLCRDVIVHCIYSYTSVAKSSEHISWSVKEVLSSKSSIR